MLYPSLVQTVLPLLTLIMHAGEINTFQGNLNWVASREHSLSNPVWNGREEEFLPLCSSGESDSANLDHVAELLVRTGIEPQESLMILVPEAYDNHPHLAKNYPEVHFPSHFHSDPQHCSYWRV